MKTQPIDTRLGDQYPFCPVVGQRVYFRPWEVIGNTTFKTRVPCGFPEAMKPLCGATATVSAILGNDRIKLSDFSEPAGRHWNYSRQMVALVGRRTAAKEARALRKAQLAKEARFARLPARAKAVVAMLSANPMAFGCQRGSVIALASAIIGRDLTEFIN